MGAMMHSECFWVLTLLAVASTGNVARRAKTLA